MQMAGIYEFRHDLDSVTESVWAIITCFICLSKTLNAIVAENSIKELMKKIVRHWTEVQLTTDFEILVKYAESGRNMTIYYFCLLYTSTTAILICTVYPRILHVVKPLNETRDREPFLHAHYFVDYDVYFDILFLHGSIVTVIGMILFTTADSTFFILITHACGLFAILGQRLERIISLDKTSIMEGNCENAHSQIIECIVKHKEAIEFSALVETIYATTYMVQLGLILLLMSTSGVLMLINMNNPFQLFKYAMIVFGVFFTLLVICYPGQTVIDHSLNIRESIYNSEWHRIPIRSRKLLLLMILRSSKPCKITVGKIYVLSMETFNTILQSAISYFTILSSAR